MDYANIALNGILFPSRVTSFFLPVGAKKVIGLSLRGERGLVFFPTPHQLGGDHLVFFSLL